MNPDIFHCPAGQLPFLLSKNCLQISTVADLNYKVNDHYTLAQRLYKDISYRWTFFRADKVAAISSFTADQITRYYRYPRHDISVIHLGVIQRAEQECATLPKISPYYLAFGQHSHKNCEASIRAVCELKNRGDASFNVIVVGDNPYIEEVLKPLASHLGVSAQIHFAGYLDDATLWRYYQSAEGLLFLSRYEGFGLPVVEAFAARCPVIASNSCSLPEVVANAGILIDPDDINGIADAMLVLRKDSEARQIFVERGLKRLEVYSWDRAAEQTANLYQRALRGVTTGNA